MALLTSAFRAQTERIHNEHLILEHILHKLGLALDQLQCYSEVYANLASAEQVARYGRQLGEQFPEHCRREEEALLAPVSAISPELAEFCRAAKDEHVDLLARLATFRAASQQFSHAEDLEEAVRPLRDSGRELT